MKTPVIIASGKNNGEGMLIHYQTTGGTDIFGLGMPNFHSSAEWDLGPTWCYLILGKKITLIDTGRFETIDVFQKLLKETGIELSDIDRVIPTHSHEDHDGNLTEILAASGAELWAHEVYPSMISYYPQIADGATHPEMPGSCRLCVMPGEFCENCLPYHKRRSLLQVDYLIRDGQALPDEDINFVFTPGHSADSICTVLEDEVIFTGDTLLPNITPHPTRAFAFQVNRRILPQEYATENRVYGLMNYIQSLNKIASHISQPLEATFPAHRLFYNGRFNLIDSSSDRAKEIIRFHINRCRDILRIASVKSASLDELIVQHFPPDLITGAGRLLAQTEILAHIEVMEKCHDVCWVGLNEDTIQHTGSDNYLGFMEAYLH